MGSASLSGSVVDDLGHDDSEFSPTLYGNYVATSNPVYACVEMRSKMLAGIPLRAKTLRR